MKKTEPAEVFAPGEFIREELAARGWNQEDLAAIMGRSPKVVSEIVSGNTGITPETAEGLSAAFGTTAQLWMNLETAYRLARSGHGDPSVARRAALYSKAPIRAMVKRHWLEPTNDVDELERRLLGFFEIDKLDDEPRLLAAARKSVPHAALTPAQEAWLFRARHIAPAAPASSFSMAAFKRAIPELRALAAYAEDVRRVPRFLSDLGIRLVIVEPLPSSRIDGACFWLNDRSPVVVLSMRFERIDSFWFTLMHELLGHVPEHDVRRGTSVSVDLDIVESRLSLQVVVAAGDMQSPTGKRPDSEENADRLAEEFLVPKPALDDFIARVGPFYSKKRIEGFALRQKVHPGIVVGQLQHRGAVPYTHDREMLVKIRSIITQAALTDGWGHSLPATLS